MFADYKSLIVEDYDKKKAGNIIALRLIQPTPRNVKEECLAVCQERFEKRDEKILRAFFGQAADQKSYLQAIEKCEIDKFKPLVNFLKKKTNDTEDKNLELLAWLIDFRPRPFELGKKYKDTSESAGDETHGNLVSIIESGVNIAGEEISGLPGYNSVTKKKAAAEYIPAPPIKALSLKRIGLAGLLLAILAFTTFSIFRPNSKPPQPFAINAQQSCMYWAGDHYQQVNCNQRMGADTMVIALDTFKLRHLRKITQQDTITRNGIGNIWYSKLDNQLEFFTAGGFHPAHPEKELRPISLYIIDKYIGQHSKAE